MSSAGSSVPEAARAAKAESDARLDRWFGAYCEAKALGGSGRAGLYRLMALADAEVAAAVAEERGTTGRALERIKSERLGINRAEGPARDERMFNAGLDTAEAILRAALASPGEET